MTNSSQSSLSSNAMDSEQNWINETKRLNEQSAQNAGK